MRNSTLLLLCAGAVLLMIQSTCAAPGSRCPPPEKVYSYSKKDNCRSDHDCSSGKICCTNPARTKSCVDPGYGSSASYDKYKNNNSKNGMKGVRAGGPGVYCGNVKCSPFQRCIRDSTGKLVCKSA